MAERLVRHALQAERAPLNQLQVKSAGISADHGYKASANSVAALKKVGIDLNDHQTTHLTESLLQEADYIFGMTQGHLDSMSYVLRDSTDNRFHLMRGFLGEENDLEIPDPFGRGFSDYEFTRDSMVEAIPSLIEFLKSQYSYSK